MGFSLFKSQKPSGVPAFEPSKDIPDLSGKVILVTGGKYAISSFTS